MMTEAYTTIENTMLYYGNEETDKIGAHFSFNFFLITDIQPQSNAKEIVTQIKRWLTYMPLDYTANWVVSDSRTYYAFYYGFLHFSICFKCALPSSLQLEHSVSRPARSRQHLHCRIPLHRLLRTTCPTHLLY